MSITDTRTANGVAIPEAGRWTIDASHSSVEFVARHLMVAKVRGRFVDVEGTVHIDERPEDSSVEVVIASTSIDTGDPRRDEHLRSADFFAVDEFPELRYRSTAVTPAGTGRWTVHGELTIKGITRPVDLDLAIEGIVRDPWGSDRAVYSASAEVDREEWGLTWNQALEGGGVLVGKSVRLQFEVETVREESAGAGS